MQHIVEMQDLQKATIKNDLCSDPKTGKKLRVLFWVDLDYTIQTKIVVWKEKNGMIYHGDDMKEALLIYNEA